MTQKAQLKADYFDIEEQLFVVTIYIKDNYIIPIDATILADDGYKWNCYLVKATYVNNHRLPNIYTCEYRKI